MRVSSITLQQQSLNAINKTQNSLARGYMQLSTGKQILSPADDPVAYGRINRLNEYVGTLKGYNDNAVTAENNLSLMESTLDGMLDSLFRINELTKQASNETLSQDDKNVIATEIEGNLSDLINLANTKDANGDYIFTGYMSKMQPYNNDGNFSYQGDQGQRKLQVGSTSFITTSYSGYQIFDDVKNGNGTFTTTDGSVTNTGSGIISNGSVTNAAAYIQDDYSVNFVTNSSGDLAYQIIGTAQGQVVPPLPATVPDDAPIFETGKSINFNGMAVTITGVPQVGDDFGISASSRQNVFTTIQNIVDTLKTPLANSADKANYQNDLERNAAALDSGISKVLAGIADIGTSRSLVEKEQNVNSDLITKYQSTLGSIEDLDYTAAITELNNQMVSLQAAQQSYVKIQNLSLLNYL